MKSCKHTIPLLRSQFDARLDVSFIYLAFAMAKLHPNWPCVKLAVLIGRRSRISRRGKRAEKDYYLLPYDWRREELLPLPQALSQRGFLTACSLPLKRD